MDDWTCYRCSYVNSNTTLRCEMCEAPKLHLPSSSSSPCFGQTVVDKNNNDDWTCAACTLFNKSVSMQCIACGSLRSGWTCAYCTSANGANRTKCKTCQRSKAKQSFVLSNNDDGNVVPVKNSRFVESQQRPITGSLVLPRRQDSDFVLALKAIQESEAAEKWSQIVAFCKQQKENFVDDSFPPDQKSLRRHEDRYNRPLPFVRWSRPKEITPEFHENNGGYNSWTIYRNPNPSDIIQGYLGNCWFLSALALLSEDLLENIIVTKDVCPEGVYQVRLCVDGQWTVVILDDFLPCDNRGRLMYSKAKRKQLWVPLIEKALAKVHGSYAALSAGTTVEGLAVLTGAPCESIKTPTGKSKIESNENEDVDEEILWATLLSCKEAGFLMGASCGKGDVEYDNENYKKLGLQSRHAYSLLDCREIKRQRLVKLRNPWGHFEWRGSWSKTAAEWTPDLKSKYKIDKDGEGTFWMPFEYFCEYFDAVDLCKLKKNTKELRMVDLLPPHCLDKFCFATHLTVTETTEIDFVLYQAKTRGENLTKHGPLDILLLVVEKAFDNRLKRVACRSTRQIVPFVTCSSVLHPGEYLLVALAFSHWGMTLALDDIPKCVVALHSSKSVHCTVSVVDALTVADSLILMLLTEGRRRQDKTTIATYTMHAKWSGEIIMVENLSYDHNLIVKCDCATSENVVCTRASMQTADVIPPRHRQILLVMSQVESSSGYSIKYSLWYLETRQSTLGSWTPKGFSFRDTHAPGIGDDIKGLHSPRPIA